MKSLKNKTLACIKKFLYKHRDTQESLNCDFTIDGINYIIVSTSNKEVKVVPSDKKYSGCVVIPPTVSFRGKIMKVTRISRYAFFHCRNLITVDLGNVKQIGDRAFEGCNNLQSIDFKSVEIIGKHAFEGCTSLSSIDFGLVKTIKKMAFKGCTQLEKLDFGNVESIGDENFIGCTNLKEINFGKVELLGDSVFEGCTGLSVISLNKIKTLKGFYVVDDNAKCGVFKNCTNLKVVDLGNVTEIHDCSFWGCPNINIIKTNLSEPPRVDTMAFHNFAYFATLFVPRGSYSTYKTHDIWSKFTIEEYG